MTDANRQLLETLYAHWRRQDVDGTVASLPEDWIHDVHVPPEILPLGGPRIGQEAVERLRQLVDQFEFLAFEPGPIMIEGGFAALRPKVSYVHKSTQGVFATSMAHFWTFEDGTPTRLDEYHSVASILQLMKQMAAPDPSAIALLDAFAAAWNRHDAPAILALMTEDCVFEASKGPDACGARHVGQEAVRRAVEDVFETFPDAQWREPTHVVSGDRAVTEWTFVGTDRQGHRTEVRGCDLFTLREGKIAVKNSYRKQRQS